jgi:diadenosine tetraphosphate (Ap4A) HIT family hydrolase
MEYLLYNNSFFTIRHSPHSIVPGHLIVAPKTAPTPLTRLPKQSLKSLGKALALATGAVDTIIKPANIYCARFTEPDLHFHVLPCTNWLIKRYEKSCPNRKTTNASNMLDWIDREARRGEHRAEIQDEVKRIMPIFREYFRSKAK